MLLPQQPIKVLLVAPLPPPIGGIASWTLNVTAYHKSLESKDINLTLCDSSSKGRRITSRSHLVRIYVGIINSFKIYQRVKNYIKNKPDVIHLVSSASFSLLKDLLIIKLAKRNSIPVITHWRFGRIPQLAEHNNWEFKLLRRVIQKSSRSIVIDLTSYSTLIKKGFTNVIQMPNPIAADVGHQTKALVDNYKKRPTGDILFVGHVVTGKGVFELVEACTPNQMVNRLTLIGPYEEHTKDTLLAIAKERNNGSWLSFLGALDKPEVLEKMREHSIIALPSYTEGFPNVVLEGMAMGTAIIGTYVGAIPEMLDVKSIHPCGICVPHQNTEELKKAIEYAVNNPKKMEEMAKNGLKKVLSSYTMEQVFAEYHEHWLNALASGAE